MTLARTKSGTMRLAEDSTGLHVEADLDPENQDVRDLRSAMRRGDVDEMSFGFRVLRQDWSNDYTQRSITEVSLHKGDVSVVNYGANPATVGATLRSRDVEAWLSSMGPEERRAYLERLARSLAESESAATPHLLHEELRRRRLAL
jgi:phage head maturation protease